MIIKFCCKKFIWPKTSFSIISSFFLILFFTRLKSYSSPNQNRLWIWRALQREVTQAVTSIKFRRIARGNLGIIGAERWMLPTRFLLFSIPLSGVCWIEGFYRKSLINKGVKGAFINKGLSSSNRKQDTGSDPRIRDSRYGITWKWKI